MSEQDAGDAERAEKAAQDDVNGADGRDADEGEAGTGESGQATDDARGRADAGEPDVDPGEELVERVAESDPESVAGELAALRDRVDELEADLREREAELEDAVERLKRKQADFQNYKKRMENRREQEKQRATEDLVERLLDVRDNLVRALGQETADAEDIRDGVETTLAQFDRVLEAENVDVVEPEPGDEVDPHTHEVLMRVDSDQPTDTVADVHRAGYVMADKVLRPAQVTVSDGDDEAGGDGSDE